MGLFEHRGPPKIHCLYVSICCVPNKWRYSLVFQISGGIAPCSDKHIYIYILWYEYMIYLYDISIWYIYIYVYIYMYVYMLFVVYTIIWQYSFFGASKKITWWSPIDQHMGLQKLSVTPNCDAKLSRMVVELLSCHGNLGCRQTKRRTKLLLLLVRFT